MHTHIYNISKRHLRQWFKAD